VVPRAGWPAGRERGELTGDRVQRGAQADHEAAEAERGRYPPGLGRQPARLLERVDQRRRLHVHRGRGQSGDSVHNDEHAEVRQQDGDGARHPAAG
jgi:hypothetical protein